MTKLLTKAVLHPQSMRIIPEQSYMRCEQPGCGKEFRIADAWSYMACIALSGSDVHISARCPEEQHFGCSPACALSLHNDCITNHLMPQVEAARKAGMTPT